MPTPLQILRSRNAAASAKPLSPAQKGGSVAGVIALILTGIYAVEGGYVNDPADRGGATNYGVTERVAREAGYMGNMKNFPKNCYGNVAVCADKIYTVQYIERPGYVPLLTIEPAVARELVDTGVNMGPAVASKFFQASLNVLCKSGLETDGKVGPRTIRAYSSCKAKQPNLCPVMLNALDGAQERRYRGIVAARPSQGRFLRGWINHRIGNVPRSACI